MSNFSHISVLLNEAVDGLNIKPGGVYIDGTTGGGGHSYEIAKRLTDGRLICEQSVYSCENIGVSDVDNKPSYGFSYKFRYLINKLLKG